MNYMVVGAILVASLVILAVAFACRSRERVGAQVGGLYSIDSGDGTFGVAKVLAIDPGAVSVRLYKQSFPERPTNVDPGSLTLGSIDDPDGFGMGHLPISPANFSSWNPVLLSVEPVAESELEGYHMWKEASGAPLEL